MNPAYDAMMFAREAHKDQKRKYTVLLSRPDYIANDRADTYMAHVTASNAKQAEHLARLDVCREDYPEVINTPEMEEKFQTEILEGGITPDDYTILLVLEGHQTDVQTFT